MSSIKPFFALVIDAGAKESYKPFIPIKYFKPSLRLTCDATTFSVTALDKTTFSLMTFSKNIIRHNDIQQNDVQRDIQ